MSKNEILFGKITFFKKSEKNVALYITIISAYARKDLIGSYE